jgi:hypothetical protein
MALIPMAEAETLAPDLRNLHGLGHHPAAGLLHPDPGSFVLHFT